MISLFEAWRRHLWLWVLPAVFCIVNLLVYAFYRSAFAGKVESLEVRHRTATERVEAMVEERRVIEQFLTNVGDHRDEVRGLYGSRFETEALRFTRAIQEVKGLARKAGLEPSAFAYPRKTFPEQGLVQRNIDFSVAGTYDQLRTFINLLELSDHFLTLNSVTLGDSGDSGRNPNLNIDLSVSTIFSARPVEVSAPVEPEEPQQAEEPTT